MDRIRGQITTPVLIGAGIGLVVGLILGLIFAWGIWPVEWSDAPIEKLRSDLKSDYLAMAIQSFDQTGNIQEAQRRWAEVGEGKDDLLATVSSNPPAPLTTDQINQFAAAVNAGALPVPGAAVTPQAQPTPGTEKKSSSLTWIVAGMCLLTLAIAGLLAYLLIFRKRGLSVAPGRAPAQSANRVAEPAVTYPEGQEPPIVQYLTTYNLGNDLYDDSFSIDSPSGEFLGECGVGISETIGVGDPKKVTAFEVWLFDKNDIQTVTKVVMSQHAFNDPSINQRLASKGEPVLAEPGKTILLETATLQLEASVVNMNYGQGALPANSFFEQMTLRLDVWPKS